MSDSAGTNGAQRPRRKVLRAFVTCLLLVICLGTAGFIYVKTHPLVFNESFLGHAHCIAAAGSTLVMYARDNGGRFPFHTNGFGDALVMLLRSTGESNPYFITGENDDGSVFREALTNGTNVPEEHCSRIYVQGLSESNDPQIVLLFDKHPSPGGDHCHGLRRIVARATREVVFLDGSHRSILANDWPQFVTKQINLLAQAGFTRANAETIYASTLTPSIKSPSQ